MPKIVASGSFDFEDDGLAHIVDDPDILRKCASSSVVHQWGDIGPKKNASLIHLVAMGAHETTGPNRNGDAWREAFLKQAHPTFKEYGALYRNHCFIAGTKVTMANRDRTPIEQVCEGDVVATTWGNHPVTQTIVQRYIGDASRLSFAGIPEDLVVTDNHPILAVKRGQLYCRHRFNKLTPSQHTKECSVRKAKLRVVCLTIRENQSI